jgi:hypothetical protein
MNGIWKIGDRQRRSDRLNKNQGNRDRGKIAAWFIFSEWVRSMVGSDCQDGRSV